nr:MAG TPA: hypothetical protein [Caudoviricetes sp.]
MGYIKDYSTIKLDQITYNMFKLVFKAGALLILNVNKIDREKITPSNPVAQLAK